MTVPIKFLNEDTCAGVKTQGGVLSRNLVNVEIICLPKDLPPHLEIDVKTLRLGQRLYLSDLKLPEGVAIKSIVQGKQNAPVVAINATRASAAAATAATEEGKGS